MLKPEMQEGLDSLIELAYEDDERDYWIFGLFLRAVRWCFSTRPRFWGLVMVTNTVLLGAAYFLGQWLWNLFV